MFNVFNKVLSMKAKSKKVDYKFTKDGKKVGVLEYVNENDVIVQEVFVNENNEEFLGGPRFVVKELYDYFPAVSWEQRELKRIQDNFRKDKEAIEKDILEKTKEIKKLQKSLEAHVKWMRNVAKQPFEEEIKKIINRLCDFYECKDMWAGYLEYTRPYVFPFKMDEVNKALDRFDYIYHDIPKFDGMRLVSLYGKTEGSFEFRIDHYGGGSNLTIDKEQKYRFFSSKEEAIQFVQDWVDEKEKYTSYVFDLAKEYGIKLNADKVREYYSSSIKSKKDDIDKKNDELTKSRASLKTYEKECEEKIKEYC